MSIHQTVACLSDTNNLLFIDSAISSSNSTTINTTIPATAQAGDLAIYNFVHDNSGVTFTYPAGWTFLQSSNASSAAGGTIAKILSASDPGTTATITASGGSRQNTAAMLVFRGFPGFKFFTTKSLNIESTSGDPVPQTVTSSADNGKSVLVIGSTSGRPQGQIGAFVSTSPAFDATITSTSLRVGYSIYNKGDTVVNHTVDMNDVGQNILQSFYMIFQ